MIAKQRREILRSKSILVIGPNDQVAVEIYDSLREQIEKLEEYDFNPGMYLDQSLQTQQEYRSISCRGVTARLQQKNGVKVWHASLYYISIDQLIALTDLFSTMEENTETIVLLCMDQTFLTGSYYPFHLLHEGSDLLYNFELKSFCRNLFGRARLFYVICFSTSLNGQKIGRFFQKGAALNIYSMQNILFDQNKLLSDSLYFLDTSSPVFCSTNVTFKQLLK